MQRLYHALPASSTPHQSVPGTPHPPLSSLSYGDFSGPEKCIFLYDERIQQRHYGMKLLAYTLINLRKFCGT